MKLNFKSLELNLAHPWTIARSRGTTSAKVVVVELTGADGTVGLGEAAPTARYKESVSTVEAFLGKVDPRALPPPQAPQDARINVQTTNSPALILSLP